MVRSMISMKADVYVENFRAQTWINDFQLQKIISRFARKHALNEEIGTSSNWNETEHTAIKQVGQWYSPFGNLHR